MVMNSREQLIAKEVKDTIAKSSSVPDELALNAYGNKHKNLVKLHHLVEALNLKGISVPKPCGIKSDAIQNFLQSCKPEIFDKWSNLQKNYEEYKYSGTAPFLELPEVKKNLATIDGMIYEAFSKKNAYELLQVEGEFDLWLEEIKKRGGHLMVRSTGAEDSKKAANAGGNTSVSYVSPSKKELCLALGEVVRSYFSLGSLQTRINSKENPFTSDLQLAVTVQELIGEPLGGEDDANEIPVSVVLFTNEPLYVGNESFRVMRISGTYGHGEAVVGNKGVMTDTVLILQSVTDPDKLYVLYDNEEKKTRLAPSGDSVSETVELVKVKNPSELFNKRVFDDEMIARLYEWGLIAECYFQEPTDMELVIKGDKIYPVQARAIVRNKQLPTYLDLKKIEENKSSY
ncbi:MAG: PEP/pyruvate-binding domain-containing protein [Chlamydiota bacterium]